MRYPILVIAVALMAGTTQARADMVYYNMTGTITFGSNSSSFSVGDHITWTVQYDYATPGQLKGGGVEDFYSLKGYALTNIVDQTNGYHFPSLPISTSSIDLALIKLPNRSVTVQQSNYTAGGSNTDVQLGLAVNAPLPTLNLAKLQLSNLSINRPDSFFDYGYALVSDTHEVLVNMAFNASVDSISGTGPPVTPTPEPGSFTLFLLGAVGLAGYGTRRRLRFRLVSFLAAAGNC